LIAAMALVFAIATIATYITLCFSGAVENSTARQALDCGVERDALGIACGTQGTRHGTRHFGRPVDFRVVDNDTVSATVMPSSDDQPSTENSHRNRDDQRDETLRSHNCAIS
jgi:hypothetical protein